MKKLEGLFIWGNNLVGTIPTELGEFPTLYYLYLGYNSLTGTIPPELGAISVLLVLSAEQNSLTGSIPPSCIEKWTELSQLYLFDNMLTGTIPDTLSSCNSSLLYLDLHSNKLVGTMPQQFTLLTELKLLYLEGNDLSGVIPSGITSLPSLVSMDLSNNIKLKEGLDSIFDVDFSSSLEYLFLSHVMITGSLPDIFQFPSLKTLVLSNNCISGTLMASTSQSTCGMNTLSLNALSLGKHCPNKDIIHGSIPPSLFAVPNLTDLYLVGNGLTGTLPELGSSSLDIINLAYNCMTGILHQL